MKTIIGMDPGSKGAVCIKSHGDTHLIDIPMVGGEMDTIALGRLLVPYSLDVHCYIERVSAVKIAGVSNSFKFGRNFGLLEGIVAGLQIPYTLIKPQAWQRYIHKGVEKFNNTAKERTYLAMSRMYPDIVLKKSKDGQTDALAIATFAEYDLRKEVSHGSE